MSGNLRDPSLIDHSRLSPAMSTDAPGTTTTDAQGATQTVGGCEAGAGESSVEDDTTILSTTTIRAFANRLNPQKILTVALLVFINLINYMDRYTISAVLPEIQKFYGISDANSGMLSTSFILSFMVLAPLFGYLGDRYNRLVIMSGGILFWAGTTLAGSFVPADKFWLFLLLRVLVGVGEASYSTIAPTIIADLFTDEWRTAVLTIFYFAIPAGAGLGFIVAGYVDAATGHWQDVLRITPAMGVLSVILLWVVLRKDPPRGEAEGATTIQATSWTQDLKHIITNKSFVLSCLGYTCQCFIVGSVAFWVPSYMSRAYILRGEDPPTTGIAKIFGLITALSGIIGVVSGTAIAAKWKHKCRSSAPDCWVSAIGLFSCAPLLFFSLVLAEYDANTTWAIVFMAEVALCLDWAIVTDILLYVTVPTRRSTAEALQILTSHLLGDAGSSYLIGLLSDAMQPSPNDKNSDFFSLQRSLFITPFVGVIGGLLFLVCAWYVDKDKAVVDAVIHGAPEDVLPAVLGVTTNDREDDEEMLVPPAFGIQTPQMARNTTISNAPVV